MNIDVCNDSLPCAGYSYIAQNAPGLHICTRRCRSPEGPCLCCWCHALLSFGGASGLQQLRDPSCLIAIGFQLLANVFLLQPTLPQPGDIVLRCLLPFSSSVLWRHGGHTGISGTTTKEATSMKRMWLPFSLSYSCMPFLWLL